MATVAAIVGAAAAVAGATHTIVKGSPDLPDIPPPAPPPPAPPPPATPPPLAAETTAGDAVGDEKRRREKRFGVQQTLLASPLGGGTDLPRGTGAAGRSLLGGG